MIGTAPQTIWPGYPSLAINLAWSGPKQFLAVLMGNHKNWALNSVGMFQVQNTVI